MREKTFDEDMVTFTVRLPKELWSAMKTTIKEVNRANAIRKTNNREFVSEAIQRHIEYVNKNI